MAGVWLIIQQLEEQLGRRLRRLGEHNDHGQELVQQDHERMHHERMHHVQDQELGRHELQLGGHEQ